MQGNMPGTVRQRIEIKLYSYEHQHHQDQEKTPPDNRTDAVQQRKTGERCGVFHDSPPET